MKRYRDCMLVCNENQTPLQLLQEVENLAIEKGYKVNRNTSLVNNDTLLVRFQFKGLPVSNIVLGTYSDKRGVSILNIVPLPESGSSQINIEPYNRILDLFMKDIFQVIKNKHNNIIETNKEDFTIQDIIPQSYAKLSRWLNGYPLSSHQCDTNRWYDFVISLHETGESLSLDALGNYVEKVCGWDEKDINKMILRLESQLDLLEYYDIHRKH